MLGTMQGREAIETQYEAASVELAVPSIASPAGNSWALGVADGLAWVLGRSEIAPVTLASVDWPSEEEVMAEHWAARDVLYGHRDGGGRPREWMAAVEHSLLWAAGGTEQLPLSPATPDLRPRSALTDELARLRACQQDPAFSRPDQEQLVGAVAALEWVLGTASTAPLSGRVADSAPGVESIEDESDLADALRYDSQGSNHLVAGPSVSRQFAAGVDQALRWAQALTDRSAL